MNKPHSLETILQDALELIDLKERAAYLDEACGGDEALREEIESLLAAHFSAEDFMATLTVQTLLEIPGEQEGDRIGRYKLLQQIGEGGFGTVYMAEQTEPVKRRVALKVIKAGMDTKEVIARFEAERQALAMMDHPNIAKVHDAGATEGGRPYFVMELVKGIPLTKYCTHNDLDTKARLALFTDVCAAVQHAHQKGIIHRDLKPGNIMVSPHDGKPVVKVIDFGIAKAISMELTEKTVFTQFGRMIGTPQYMSPEQAELNALDIDTRSDIYSLGVVLYELLTGTTPLDGAQLRSAAYNEMQRLIREETPPKPSTRVSTISEGGPTSPTVDRRALQGDLDWIVMKALEKDRARRYETANAFATDIRRHLGNEPVLAVAPSAAYTFQKFVRRNKTAFRVTAALLALLLAGIATTTWQAFRASAEAERATAAKELATVEAERATVAEELATAEAERATTAEKLAAGRLVESEVAREDAEATSKFLTDMFTSSMPGARKGGREIKVADILDDAVRDLKSNTGIPPHRRAVLQGTLGSTYHALGLVQESIPVREAAHKYFRSILGPEHPDSLSAAHNLALSYEHGGRLEEAFQLQKEILKLRKKVNGPEHRDTFKAMESVANSLLEAEQLNECLKISKELFELRRKVLGPRDPDTLNTMHNLAMIYSYVGRVKEALELQESILPLRILVNGPKDPDTLRAMHNLAQSLHAAKRSPEAFKLHEKVLALRKEVLGPNHPNTIATIASLASAYFGTGRYDKALELREEVLELSSKFIGLEHPSTLGAMTNLAASLSSVKRLDEAIDLQINSLNIKRRVLPPSHRYLHIALQQLVFLYEITDHADEAKRYKKELDALPGGK